MGSAMTPFLFSAPGRAHPLGGASPLHARQGELLAGRQGWWNSGVSHMNQAFPKKFFDKLGLVSLLDSVLKFQCNS